MRLIIFVVLYLIAAPVCAGEWIADNTTGCKVLLSQKVTPHDSISWSGPCEGGLANGQGTLQWYSGDKKVVCMLVAIRMATGPEGPTLGRVGVNTLGILKMVRGPEKEPTLMQMVINTQGDFTKIKSMVREHLHLKMVVPTKAYGKMERE